MLKNAGLTIDDIVQSLFINPFNELVATFEGMSIDVLMKTSEECNVYTKKGVITDATGDYRVRCSLDSTLVIDLSFELQKDGTYTKEVGLAFDSSSVYPIGFRQEVSSIPISNLTKAHIWLRCWGTLYLNYFEIEHKS